MVPLVTPNLDLFYPEPGMRLKEEQYELLRHLGSGQYSTTWLAFDFKAAYVSTISFVAIYLSPM